MCAQKKRGGEIKGERERESFDRKKEGKERKRRQRVQMLTQFSVLTELVIMLHSVAAVSIGYKR